MNQAVHLDAITADSVDNIVSRFAVPAIRCAGCISKIENGLLKEHDIISARVNFSTKQVAVSHLSELREDQIKSRIEQLGFDVQILADNPLAEEKGDTGKLIRALAVAGFGMMNIMLLSVSVWSGAIGTTRDLFHWISALIAIPVILYSGRPFFSSAFMALRYGRTNMDVPITVGIILATGLSLFETMTSGVHAYFESVVMLIFFLLAGRVLDGMMRDRARDGISALLKQTASGAMVLGQDGPTSWVNAKQLRPDMMMVVAAGDNLAADGVIHKGASNFDFSLMTGESEPQPKAKGDTVLAGTLNLTGPVTVRVTAVGEDTSLSDIARLMDEAGQQRSFYVRVADKAARYYAPAVHSLALLAFIFWMFAGVGWHQSLLISVAVLIITCPCALGLAVPAAQVVASGALLRNGVMIKDGSALERLAEADRALFDKTGTLTLGRPVPVTVSHLSLTQKQVALALAQASNHPVSKGIRAALLDQGVTPVEIEDPNEVAGQGMSGRWDGIAVALGKPIKSDDHLSCQLRIGNEQVDIELQDEIRPDVVEAIKRLKALGLPATIISGDNAASVAKVSTAVGLTAQAGASPQDKLQTISRLRSMGLKVLMVGDGLNDGPALAAAHVSIAPGSASDVGQQAADAVFTSNSFLPVALAVQTARRTMQIVRQNFALAIGYNILAVPLALTGMVTPLIAAVAMSLSSLIVVGNALRLNGAAK
ncbi:heavy metal translocating P-type ATPase [Parasphingorhabdus cellanae]|uniref:Cadmium-translocating P-type ATPase n=1 Tax=Parasphingorhabdus cellanae TaxID=2806553 RepID=A0ABX7T5X7_9SPHN|nr:heavy metal translocating P-type ATPase [Parasphingorhabdus cellanae]QTD56995.1 cadmium-translocating P-type ATPase [Parasphingorhabdus cellanae]